MNKEQIEKAIADLNTAGVYTLVAEKNSYKPLKNYQGYELKKIYTTVINLTKQSYSTFKNNGIASQPTYAHSISDNHFLLEHNSIPEKRYLRMYKSANTEFFPYKAQYFFNGIEIDKSDLQFIKQYFRKESGGETETFNVLTENIISLKHGDIRITKQ